MQATSDKTASANFTQTGFTSSPVRGITDDVTSATYGKTGYSPFFQWGRKDAFRSKEYTAAPAANTSMIHLGTSVTIGATIQTPTTMYESNAQPYNESFYYNAWNATFTTYNATFDKINGLEKVVKTVYDPCPVGYTVTPGNAFIDFNSASCPGYGNGCSYTSNGKTLYIPLAGERDGSTGKINNYGRLWFAAASSATQSRFLGFDSSNMQGVGIVGRRTAALPIRPVREN